MAALPKEGAQQRHEEFVPLLNRFIGGGAKAETTSYSMVASVLEALCSDTPVPKESAERSLSRLCQYGGISIGTIEPLLKALEPSPLNRADRELCRLLYYLVQLSLGDGYAGTPMPVPRNHNPMLPLPKAVDRFGPELLSLSWADLGNENSRFLRKQGGMRALAALSHASMTSKPDDLTYVGGMLVTLQSLLERIEQLHQEKVEHIAAKTSKKSGVAEFKGSMEMWGLLRLALSAARVALSQGGVAKIANKSFLGVASPDPLCARHALAIASTVARDPQGAGIYVEQVEHLLRNNLDAAKETGLLYSKHAIHKPTTDITGAPVPPPKVVRQEQEASLNLWCVHSRMYLARGCASSLQSGFIGGDVRGSGDVFWRSLILMLICDPSNLVALECIRNMFGAPHPHAENLRKRPTWMAVPGHDIELESLTLARVYGASWHMVVAEADELVPLEPVKPMHESLEGLQGTGTEPDLATISDPSDPKAERSKDSKSPLPNTPPASLIAHVVSRLLHALDSPSPALSAAACRTSVTIFEARAWCTSLSNGYLLQSKPMQDILLVLERALVGVLASMNRTATEHCYAAQALLWSQLGPADHAHVTPSLLLKSASHGGLSVHSNVKALFADPWPEALISMMLATLLRRIRCTPSMAKGCFELAAALAAAAPSRVTKDQMQVLWESAPGATAVHSALALLSSPPPPITQPNVTAPVEVKALATNEEAAFESLRGFAAWWLGEHINGVCGVLAWKPPPKASVIMPFLIKQQQPQQQGKQQPKGQLQQSQSQPQQQEQQPGQQQQQQQQQQQGENGPKPGGQGGATEERSADSQPRFTSLDAIGLVETLDPLERMALAAAVHAPLLAAVLSHLQRTVLTGRWELCVSASQALAKVAVRSPEPYRIQAYSALMSAVQMGGTTCADSHDPLGLSAVVAPALEVLNAMYAGELALSSHIATYGTNHKEWPKPALASLQRRHDWLIAMISQRVGLVPKDTFFPLGKASRQLLRPDLPPERVAEDGEPEPESSDSDREEGGNCKQKKKKKDGKPERDPLYEYYGDEDYEQAEEDLLEKFLPGEKHSKLAKVNWGRLGEDAASSDRDAYFDEDDVRPGTMLYPFSAMEEGEVSAAAGERVQVAMDMGDWLQVITPSGAQGLVPASYVRVEEGADSSSMEGSIRSRLGRRTEQDQSYNGYDTYEPYDYGAGYTEEYGGQGTGGRLDDFGSALTAAAEAKSHRAREAQQAALQQRASSSESSSLSGALHRRPSDMDALGYQEDDAESERTADEPPPAYTGMTYGSLARALYEFEAQDENEISMREDEELEVQGPEEDGWYPVMRMADGQMGLVPASYIEHKPLF